MTGSIYGDEYVFIRITENLPDSRTSADWLLADHPELVDTDVTGDYLMYPLFKIIDPTIPRVARSIPLVLMLVGVFLLVDIIRRKFNLTVGCLSVLPFLLSNQLLGGGLWLYYDAFMIAFFIISLWIIYTKPQSKWLYVTITAMLLSKETGLFYMLPLLIAYYHQTRNIKHTVSLLLPIISTVVWVVYTGVISGNILYIWYHFEALRPTPSLLTINWTIETIRFTLLDYGLLFYFILTIPGFILATIETIRTKSITYLPFMLFYIIPLCCGAVGLGFAPYQMHSMLYAGMMITVLSISIFCKDILTIGKEREFRN
jgi:hypothetical protein